MNNSFFTADFFTGNRQRLHEICEAGVPIVIAANGLLQRGADSTYAFSQDASFWYLTGIDEPDVALVIDGNTEYLIMPELSDYQVAFDGALGTDQITERSGINTVLHGDAGWQKLADRLATTKKVSTLHAPPQYIDVYGMYTNPARASVVQRLQAQGNELVDISLKLMEMRVIKQAPELQAMQHAIDITADTLTETIAAYRKLNFEYEYQIEAEISRGFRARGASGHAFEPIVAAGKRACTLHNVANNGALSIDDLIVLDVGAEVEHYAADITRTYSLGTPTGRQQAVYDAVLDVQNYAKGLLKPGVILNEYEQLVETYMGTKLLELGVIDAPTHEAIRTYYPHSTSHFVGLNVHDTGDGRAPLQAGMVITVEPGIYIADEGIGIRIEDDVLITTTGIKVLTEKLVRDLQ